MSNKFDILTGAKTKLGIWYLRLDISEKNIGLIVYTRPYLLPCKLTST